MESAAEAVAIVEQTRYPMKGKRGVAGLQRANRYGRVPNNHRNASEDIALVMQIESPAGVKAAAEIASVGGVDATFVGPSDLAATMDYLGNASDQAGQAAISEAQRAARSVSMSRREPRAGSC
ncbi:aldolase/citrate lyase family protein [Paraburkholderia sp. BL17N1]|uniref:aldolase/citrate lyase family protein n=1 Tax=Paraburkholderia sp. BL17N1 TaxID=1938798 RepID=UPI002410CE34|nr:aldolase/citrate lyase family protein [Paraburkholderia sp. BL17N1]